MGEDPRAKLRSDLGTRLADALEPLGEEEARRLAEAILRARSAERRALREAAEDSLGFVPRFARGAVKKIVFG